MRIVKNQIELESALSDTKGGYAIALEGVFDKLVFKQQFLQTINIFAHRAVIKGIVFEGCGVTIAGGRVEAPDGSNGFASAGYGVFFRRGSYCNTIAEMVIRNCDRAVVLDKANRSAVYRCDVSVRQDGIIANGGEDVVFAYNWFHDFYPKPSTCTLPDSSVLSGLSSKDCVARGGTFKDGDHSDAIQIRNGMRRVQIIGNYIDNTSQGIGQMDGPSDAWCDDVTIIGNNVEVNGFHSITVERTSNLKVIGNRTKQLTGRRSLLRLSPGAIEYDNEVLSP